MLTGIITALAMQKQATVINFVAQWLIAMAVQIYLAFYCNYGIVGIWLAKIFADSSLIALCYMTMVDCVADWDMRT